MENTTSNEPNVENPDMAEAEQTTKVEVKVEETHEHGEDTVKTEQKTEVKKKASKKKVKSPPKKHVTESSKENIEVEKTEPLNENTDNTREIQAEEAMSKKEMKSLKEEAYFESQEGANLRRANTDIRDTRRASADSSLKDFITHFNDSNAEKLYKEIVELEQDATSYVDFLTSTYNDFINIQKRFGYYAQKFRQSFYTFLGFKYSPMHTPTNFFTYATQAWLIEFIKHLVEHPKNNFKFADLYNVVLNFNFNETRYEENLDFITSVVYADVLSESIILVTEKQMGSQFFNNLKQLCHKEKTQLHSKKEHSSKEKPLTKTEFDRKIMLLIKKAVEACIIQIESEAHLEDKLIFKHFHFFKTFEDLSHSFYGNQLTFETYYKKLLSHFENPDFFDTVVNKRAAECYYYFAKMSLNDIIIDLRFFNQNSQSCIHKLKSVIRLYYKIANDVYVDLMAFIQTIMPALRDLDMKQIKQLGQAAMDKGIVTAVKLAKFSKKRVEHFKVWVGESAQYAAHIAATLTKFGSLRIIQAGIMLSMAYLSQLSFISLITSEKAIIYTLTVFNFFRNEISVFVSKFNEFLFSLTPLIRKYIQINESNERIQIVISKDLLIVKPQVFQLVYHKIMEIVNSSEDYVANKYNRIADVAGKNIDYMESFVLDKYKKFLGMIENGNGLKSKAC